MEMELSWLSAIIDESPPMASNRYFSFQVYT